MLRLISFGYRAGPPPNATHVFDCRKLKNPHFEPALRDLDGRTPQVQTFVEHSNGYSDIHVKAKFYATTEPDAVIAFGCYGGRHRSVACAELLALSLAGRPFAIEHRELRVAA